MLKVIVIILVFGFLVHGELKPGISFGGELEYEYVFNNADDLNPEFKVDKFVLEPEVKFGDFVELSAQFYFLSERTYLNELHAKFFGLPQNSWLDIGLYERFIKEHHSRKTETYSLYGNSFYRDDTFGISWGNWAKKFESPTIYWIVSISQGYRIWHKQPGEQTSRYDGEHFDRLIQDDFDPDGDLLHPEIGLNLGFNFEDEPMKFDVVMFYYRDAMDANDRDKLEDYLSDDQEKKLVAKNNRARSGIQMNMGVGDIYFFLGFLFATDAGLFRSSYVLEVFYEFKLGKVFRSMTPVVSWSGYFIEGESDFDKPESWDREQLIIGGIFEIYDKINLKVEYILNDEGMIDIKNDEFLVQIEIQF